LFAITILAVKMKEFQRPLWVVAVDFKKAFDSVHQHSIWQALREQAVPDIYISVLMKLYKGQVGRVQTDSLSKEFPIERGTKQGDPISPILFNAVLEKALKIVKDKWAIRRAGIQVGYGREGLLTNLRFADDILLIGKSLAGVRRMLSEFIEEAQKVGLEIHMGKTKILSKSIVFFLLSTSRALVAGPKGGIRERELVRIAISGRRS
jgi:retron-type reverse transcriptase